MEEWRDIEGYEGLYQVSNYGRVKALERSYTERNSRKATHTLEERILKPSKYSKGYLYVTITKNDERKIKKIHRLVAEAFIPNPNGYDVVHHKDHNPSNNCVENLEWMNKEDHDKEHGIVKSELYKGKHHSKETEFPSKVVYKYDLNNNLLGTYQSTAEAAIQNGVCQAAVSACCRNCFNREGNNIYKGHKWSYEPL